jgi:hypothetical protein
MAAGLPMITTGTVMADHLRDGVALCAATRAGDAGSAVLAIGDRETRACAANVRRLRLLPRVSARIFGGEVPRRDASVRRRCRPV